MFEALFKTEQLSVKRAGRQQSVGWVYWSHFTLSYIKGPLSLINAAALLHGSVYFAEHGQLRELRFDSMVNFSLQFGSTPEPALCCLILLPQLWVLLASDALIPPAASVPLVLVFVPAVQSTLTSRTAQPKSEVGAATKNTQENPILHLQMLCLRLCGQGTATCLSHCPSLQHLAPSK